jgi:ABC-type Fe3+ transport system permease subunit
MVRGANLGIFLNTLLIGIFTTFFSLIIGVTTALIMARIEIRGKTLLGGFLLIPLVLPPFVSGVGFMALMGDKGLINEHFLAPVFGIKIILEGIVAIIFVQVMHYFTLIYLNVYSSLMNNDPSLEESAENLGASKLTVLRTVTLPLAMPGIASGSILVLILAMEDLGTPIIFAGFGDTVAKQTITYYIAKHIWAGSETSELAQESTILGAFLLIFAVIGFFAIRKFVSLKQYSMVSKGRAGEYRTIKPNFFANIVLYLYFFGLLATALMPHIGVIIASMAKPQIFPLDLSFDNYQHLFDAEKGFGLFIKNTLVYSLISTAVIMVLATLAGYVANRKKFWGQTAFDTLVTIPIAIPGIVLGIGYIRMFGDSGRIGNTNITLNPIIFPGIILVISYTIRKFPFTVRAVYAGLQQTDVVMEEAAVNMGASRLRIIVEVVIPLIGLNIIGGALVSLVYNMSEVSTTLVLISNPTYGTLTYEMSRASGKVGELAAIGVFLMVLQAISLLTTNLLLKNRADAITGL